MAFPPLEKGGQGGFDRRRPSSSAGRQSRSVSLPPPAMQRPARPPACLPKPGAGRWVLTLPYRLGLTRSCGQKTGNRKPDTENGKRRRPVGVQMKGDDIAERLVVLAVRVVTGNPVLVARGHGGEPRCGRGGACGPSRGRRLVSHLGDVEAHRERHPRNVSPAERRSDRLTSFPSPVSCLRFSTLLSSPVAE